MNAEYLKTYLQNNYNINSLEKYVESFEFETSRSENIELTGSSKSRKTNVAKGFLITSFSTINGILNNKPFSINPPAGSSVFIHDIDNFNLEADVIIVGVENQENFNQIHKQKHLFSDRNYCFFSRYFTTTKPFQEWLSKQTNQYLHFGDFDLAGIAIYITEIKPYLKNNKSSYFVPKNIEELFQNYENKQLYIKQNSKYNKEKFFQHEEIQELINLIEEYKAGVEQEILIK